jgi:hypothetical protein
MPSQIQIRRGTSAQWSLANTVLAAGEMGVETDHSPVKLKVGNGVSTWTQLPFLDSGAMKILGVQEPLVFDPLTGILSLNYQEIIDGNNF